MKPARTFYNRPEIAQTIRSCLIIGKGPVDRVDNMRVFLKVVDSGNFISAAARLRKHH
jgi:hypothetical protein